MTNAVAKQSDASLTKYNYGNYANKGLENVKATEKLIPFLGVIQGQSPQKLKSDEKYIQGAQDGMIFNSATKELYPAIADEEQAGLIFLPCHRATTWVERIHFDDGGGLVGEYPPGHPYVIQRQRESATRKIEYMVDGKRRELVETHRVSGLILDEEGETVVGPAVISFNISKMKPYRKWITDLDNLRQKTSAPFFAFPSQFQTYYDAKMKCWNYRISPFGETWQDCMLSPDNPIMEIASQLHDGLEAGTVKADVSGDAVGEGNTSSSVL